MSFRALFLLVGFLFIAPSVANAQAPFPSCYMTVAPATINKGGSVTLKWSSQNATSANIPGPGLGAVETVGQRNLIPISSTRWVGTFTGPGGKTTCSATVLVLNDGSPMVVTEAQNLPVSDPGTTGASGGGSAGTPSTVAAPGNVGAPGGVGGAGTVSNPGTVSGPGSLPAPNAPVAAPILPTAAPVQVSQSEGTGIVPCTGLNCQACDLAKLGQNIVNFLIGLSIPLAAAMFAWAGVLYFSSSVVNKLEKAKKIFTSVLIGFSLAVGSWLIVQTFLSTVLKDSYKNWNTIQCVSAQSRPMNKTVQDLLGSINILNNLNTSSNPALQGAPRVAVGQSSVYGCPPGWEHVTEFAQCINPNDRTQVIDATRTGASYFNAFNGDINAAINGYLGADTSMGPDGGNLACAWAVNNILASAGIPPLGNGVGVASMETALLNGRGLPMDQTTAQAGDIVIWGTGSHVGFCQNDGCTQVISNSSGQARFNYQSPFPAGSRIYRVTR